MFNNTTAETSQSTQLDIFILIEISYQCVFFAVGVPINVLSLRNHWNSLRERSSKGQDHRLARLSLHLIIANLTILAVYCCARSVWLYTFWWRGGDILCRVYSFVSSFAFYLSSNIVAAISIDLCHCVSHPLRAQMYSGSFVRRLITGAWVLAALLAAPQLVLRGTVTITKEPMLIEQCYFLYYKPEYHSIRMVYGIAHLLGVFYLPLMTILLCYVGISLKIRNRLSERKSITTDIPICARKSVAEISQPLSPRSIVKNRAEQLKGGSANGIFTEGTNRKSLERASTIHIDSAVVTETGSDPPISWWNDISTRSKMLHDEQNGHCCDSNQIEKELASFSPPRRKDTLRRISRSLALKLRHMSSPDLGSLARKESSDGYRIQKRIFLLSASIIGTYIFTWLPYQVFAALKLVCTLGSNCGKRISDFEWLEALLLLSTCITPFLYSWNCRQKPKRIPTRPIYSARSSAARYESGFGSMSQPTQKSVGSEKDFLGRRHTGIPNGYIMGARRNSRLPRS